MAIGLLLVNVPGGLVHESQIVLFIDDQDGIEEGENLEVDDDFVDREGGYFEGGAVAVDREGSDALVVEAGQVKSVLFLAVLQMLDRVVVHKFGIFLILQILAQEGDLIPRHHTDSRQRHHLHNIGNHQFVAVDPNSFLNLLWFQPHLLHIEQPQFIQLFRESEEFVDHVDVDYLLHLLRQGEEQLVQSCRLELGRAFRNEVRKVD